MNPKNMEQSPTCRLRVKNCKIKDEKNSNSENIFEKDGSVGENIRKIIRQGPLLMDSGSRLVWIGLVECLDNVRCVHKVFRQFPNLWHWGCCRSLSTQPGKAVLTPCDSDQSCCPGSDELPTCWHHPTQSVVVGLWLCWESH